MRMNLALVSLLAAALVAAGCAGPTPTPTPAATPTPTAEPVDVSPATGAELARAMGCAGCHTFDGNPSVGPTWKGLYQSERTLADGSTVMADQGYLFESIVAPGAKVVEGFFPGIMPENFRNRLSDPEIQAIIEFIKTLP